MSIELRHDLLTTKTGHVRLKDVMYNPLNEQVRGIVIGFSIDTDYMVSCVLHMLNDIGRHFQNTYTPPTWSPIVDNTIRRCIPLSELLPVDPSDYTEFEKETLLKISGFNNVIPEELKSFLGKTFVDWTTDKIASVDIAEWTMDSAHISAKYITSIANPHDREFTFIPKDWCEILVVED